MVEARITVFGPHENQLVDFLESVRLGTPTLKKFAMDVGVYQARHRVLEALGRLLEKNTLEHFELYFGRCDNHQVGFTFGQSFLEAQCRLQVLKIPSFRLGDEAMELILQGLRQRPPRQGANDSMDTLFDDIQKPMLQKLDVSGNDLTAASLPTLAAFLISAAETLQFLRLDFNRRLFANGGAVVEDFLNALHLCSVLQSLSMKGCGMDGTAVLCLLRHHLPQSLVRLDLNHNPITESTLIDILQDAVPRLTILQRLLLVPAPREPSENVQLAYWEALRRNLSLHMLDVGIPDSDKRKGEYRARNHRLQQVAQLLAHRPMHPGLLAAAATSGEGRENQLVCSLSDHRCLC
eukprot:scaffold1850_cov170-Amphora_coffeaeformis.AAC.4